MRKRTKICLIGTALVPLGLVGRFFGHAYVNRRIGEAFSGGRPYQATLPWPWYVGMSNDAIFVGLIFLVTALTFLGLDCFSKYGGVR